MVRCISGTNASAGAPRGFEQPCRGAIDRDQIVRRDRRRRHDRPRGRGRRSRTAAGRVSRPASARAPRRRCSPPVIAPHAPSSCSGPRQRVNVCSGCSPKRLTCGSSAASGVAPLTCAIHGPAGMLAGDRRDGAVRDAEQHEVGVPFGDGQRRAASSRAATADPTRPRPTTLHAVMHRGALQPGDLGA